MLRSDNRLNLTGVPYAPKGVTPKACQVERSLSPPFAYYSRCGKVNIGHLTEKDCFVD